MLTAYVWLHILVWDADTGILLKELAYEPHAFSVSGDKIEDCRLLGVATAKRLTARYRERGHPNAFTNVDCEWKSRLGDPA
jgi:hypothetical protein